jgi:hypothetical protein
MQTPTQQIEVHFPIAPPSLTPIGVMVGKGKLEDFPRDLAQHRGLRFPEDRPERRGIPESALHD